MVRRAVAVHWPRTTPEAKAAPVPSAVLISESPVTGSLLIIADSPRYTACPGINGVIPDTAITYGGIL